MITSYFVPKGKKRNSSEAIVSLVEKDWDGITTKSTVANSEVRDEVDPKDVVNVEPSPKRTKKTVIETSVFSSSHVPTEEVRELLLSLDDSEWKHELESTFRSSSFSQLAKFVWDERGSHTIYPPCQDTWTALNLCPFNKTRVVIVGQDPYHGPGQAHGLCFSVLPGQVPPPSLQNIFVELEADAALNFGTRPKHGHLVRWAKQGVLLLNNVLSVRRGHPNSHAKKGWEQVTAAILRICLRRPCVFLLWGKPAAERIESLQGMPSKRHVFITTSHPSPLGARKTNKPFLGSQCFSRCNAALRQLGMEPIDWKVDGPLPQDTEVDHP